MQKTGSKVSGLYSRIDAIIFLLLFFFKLLSTPTTSSPSKAILKKGRREASPDMVNPRPV